MFATFNRTVSTAVALAFLTTACGQSNAVPSPAAADSGLRGGIAQPAASTSILKGLTKDVTIGSTVDPTNGDQGPRSLALVTYSFGKLKKGDLLVCNFENSSGTAGAGTTVELLSSVPGSKPTTFVQSSKIQGCDGVSIDEENEVWVSGLTSKQTCQVSDAGKLGKCHGSPTIADPLTNGYGAPPPGSSGLYSPYFIFVGDIGSGGTSGDNGSIVNFSLGSYGTGKDLQVVTGFPSTKVNGWQTYGPSGFSYNSNKGNLFVVDGANNTLTEIIDAPNLLLKDEIVVQNGGKSFKCLHQSDTCAKLLHSGAPLDAPVATAMFFNGNVVAANTAGSNELIEFNSAGKVLDTKVVDTGSTPAVVGLWAIGRNAGTAALFYTDVNSNTVQELEQ